MGRFRKTDIQTSIYMQNHIKLIDGTFTPAEAKRVLITLINDKINYHELERFSHFERYGHEPLHSIERITALRNERSRLIESIREAEQLNKDLKITGMISMQLVNPAQDGSRSADR